VFKKYWANPAYGQDGQGIYTKLSYSDCDFFMMDDRSFRSSDRLEPRIDGKPNPDKKMWGDKQMEWLKNSLVSSNAVFKIIVTGSQTLNVASPWTACRITQLNSTIDEFFEGGKNQRRTVYHWRQAPQ
jgi:alkaline phosphatase D